MARLQKICVLGCLIACTIASASCARSQDSGDDLILYSTEENASENEKVTIKFFGFKADAMNLTAIESAMQDFMEEHKNINITYEGIKGMDYWDAFDKRDTAGVLDDVMMMDHDHIIRMTEQGKLADLSGLEGIENYSDEAKIQFMNEDGSVYFLPTCISTYNLYINYDILSAHGLEVPENWEQFRNCCDYFVKEGIVPIVANNRNSIPTLISGRGLYDTYQQKDIESILKSFNEDPALLAETLAPGIEQTADMIKRGWFDIEELKATEQTSDDLDLFVKGDRPFMISGGWAATRVMVKEPGFSYGVHPYPILDDGCVLSLQVDTCISVNAYSLCQDEAKEFVSYLIKPDVMWNYCNSQASYTALNDDRLPSEKTLIPSTEYLYNGRVAFRNEYRLSLPVETALFECAKTLLNGGTAEEAEAALLKVLSE